MEPKIGEYWYISSGLKISWDGEPPFEKQTCVVIAQCVRLTNNGPIFYGPRLTGFGYTIYGGESGWSYELIYKWEPNWFWKMLGYK